jgi:hypothetical protein
VISHCSDLLVSLRPVAVPKLRVENPLLSVKQG